MFQIISESFARATGIESDRDVRVQEAQAKRWRTDAIASKEPNDRVQSERSDDDALQLGEVKFEYNRVMI
ncbi:MAG: hypothetical protein AAF434_18155 [Pseudomonadota bacterium]